MGLRSDLSGAYDDVKNTVEKVPIVGPLLSGPKTASTSPLTGEQAGADALTTQFNAQNASANAAPIAAPTQQAVTIDRSQSGQTRAQQEQAIQALQQAAAGTTPSAAELQLKQQAANNNAQALNNAAALRGRSAGSSFQAANRQNALNQLQTNADAASARAAEQANARAALTGALSGVQSQDQATAQAQAALTQSANANNLQSALTTTGQNITKQQNTAQDTLGAQGLGITAAGDIVGANTANAQTQNSYEGGLLGGAGALGVAALSDERSKEDIEDATAETRDAIEALKPYSFRYKDSENGEGDRLGIMAQDMAKTPVGRDVVIKGKRLKLDMANSMGLALAGLSDIQRRLKKVEARKGAYDAAA